MDEDMHFKFVQDRVRIRILWDELRWRSRFTVYNNRKEWDMVS